MRSQIKQIKMPTHKFRAIISIFDSSAVIKFIVYKFYLRVQLRTEFYYSEIDGAASGVA